MIVNVRVDHRLLHGQVAMAWNQVLGSDCILIANDSVRNDEIRKAGIAHLADGWRQAAGDQLALVGQINSIVGLDKSHHTLKVRVRNQHGGKGIPCVTSVCLNTHGLANVRNPKPA